MINLNNSINNFKKLMLSTCLLFLNLLTTVAIASDQQQSTSLSLETAIKAAQDNDPWLTGNKHKQDSIEAMSIAEGTLPDPKVSVSMVNLAADSFDFGQEAMTNFKVGVSQMFPRGDSLALRKKQLQLFSSQFPYQREDRRAKITVKTAQLWLEAYKSQQSIALIEKDRALFEQLADVAEASYSSAVGKTRQQDIVRAQLELTRLEDRLTLLKQKQEMTEEALFELISEYLSGSYSEHSMEPASSLLHYSFSTELPNIQMIEEKFFTTKTSLSPQQLSNYFSNHPAVKAIEQKIKASASGIDLAKQKYRPEWGVNASYGYRDADPFGVDRSDLFSIGVSFDIPLFTSNRQDKQLKSAVSETSAVKTEKWLLLRNMIATFETRRAQLYRLNQRQKLFQDRLLPQMHDQAEASLTAYTNDDGDFAEVIRSRIAELNATIDSLNINVDRQKTIVQLNYFFMKSAEEIISRNRNAGALK